MKKCNISSHYYRDYDVPEGDPIVEAIEELQRRATADEADIDALELRAGETDTRLEVIEEDIENLNDLKSQIEKNCVFVKLTDTNTQIQQKIWQPFKSTVVFEPGIYRISQTIQIPSDKRLIGYGATVNFLTSNMVGFCNYGDEETGGYDQNKNILIEGFTFKATTSKTLTMLGFIHSEHVTIRNCHFADLGAWHMVEFNGCRHCTIENCDFSNYVGSSATEMIQIDIATSEEVFPWFGPYDNTKCEDINITNCNFKNPFDFYTARGAQYTPAAIGNHNQPSVYTNNIHISGCTFENMQSALKFMNLHNATIIGNEANSVSNFFSQGSTTDVPNQLAGIVMSANVIVCTQWDDFSTAAGHRQRAIDGHFTNSVINSNEIWGASDHGITFRGNGITISGNKIENSGRNGIYAYCADNVNLNGNTVKQSAVRELTDDADIAVKDGDDTAVNVLVNGNVVNEIFCSSASCVIVSNIVTTEINGTSGVKHGNLIQGAWTA